jgi:uncharacterized Fe-S cluster-containing MiaB family protein
MKAGPLEGTVKTIQQQKYKTFRYFLMKLSFLYENKALKNLAKNIAMFLNSEHRNMCI